MSKTVNILCVIFVWIWHGTHASWYIVDGKVHVVIQLLASRYEILILHGKKSRHETQTCFRRTTLRPFCWVAIRMALEFSAKLFAEIHKILLNPFSWASLHEILWLRWETKKIRKFLMPKILVVINVRL